MRDLPPPKPSLINQQWVFSLELSRPRGQATTKDHPDSWDLANLRNLPVLLKDLKLPFVSVEDRDSRKGREPIR